MAEKNFEKPLNLTLAQFVLLAGIAWLERFEEPITQVKLARHAKVDIMMTSDVIKTLESKGLVERTKLERDSRANMLLLTLNGKQRVKKAIEIVERADKDFFAPLGQQTDSFLKNLLALNQSNQIVADIAKGVKIVGKRGRAK